MRSCEVSFCSGCDRRNSFETEMIISSTCSCMVARSCTLSGLSAVCGCIHGCTLSVLRNALVANADCI